MEKHNCQQASWYRCIAIVFIDWVLLPVALVASLLPLAVPALFASRIQRTTEEYTATNEAYIGNVIDNLNGRLEILRYGVIRNVMKIISAHNSETEHSPSANLDAHKAEVVIDSITSIPGIKIVISHSSEKRILSRFDEIINLDE